MLLEDPIPGKSAAVFHGPMADELGFHLRRALLASFRHFAHAVSAAEGITPGLYGMLQAIGNNPGLSQSALAIAMEVDRSSIVKVVDQLEQKGLIVRDASPSDRRRYRLQLTATGARALRRDLDLAGVRIDLHGHRQLATRRHPGEAGGLGRRRSGAGGRGGGRSGGGDGSLGKDAGGEPFADAGGGDRDFP